MKLLVFHLESILQSWGERSRWDWRDSAVMPTKSGVVGLLGCALGWLRGDKRLAELSYKLKMAVRADRMGEIMTDYHTVQRKEGNILNALRKPRPGNTIVSHRQYLQDASFTVFLASDEDMLDTCADALRHPAFTPYLGRKCCPPTLPLLPQITEAYASLDDAVRQYWPLDPHGRARDKIMAIQIEGNKDEVAAINQSVSVRMDEVVCSSHYQFARRAVCNDTVCLEEVKGCT